jgi:DNA-binding transcriptional regulator PaaX
VLEWLGKAGTLMLDAWLPRSYPEARIWRDLLGIEDCRRWNEKESAKMKKLLSATLSRLKAKGFVLKTGSTRNAEWQISKHGKKALTQQHDYMLPSEDGRIRCVIFDVPEIKKRDRDWLRSELISAGYAMLQKSVWLGKRPLTEDFINMLRDKDLLDAIHIFEVKEEGTLSNLKI